MVESSASFASVNAGRITALPRGFTGEGLGMSRRSSMYMLRALSSASTASMSASSASSPKVLAFGNVGEFHPHGSVGIAFQGDRVSQHGVSSHLLNSLLVTILEYNRNVAFPT